jgi:thiosulfate dehydrogenase (quinone) large subunit
MNKAQTFLVLALRVLLGWVYFYAGITKVLDPAWSAAAYIKGAKTFPDFFAFLLQPGMLPVVDFLNTWGLTILGACLILGLLVRYVAPLGAVLMILYYLPILDFPMVGGHSYLVDEHIIYAAVLLFLAAANAGKRLGVDAMLKIRS